MAGPSAKFFYSGTPFFFQERVAFSEALADGLRISWMWL
jgi:hypothetical protein